MQVKRPHTHVSPPQLCSDNTNTKTFNFQFSLLKYLEPWKWQQDKHTTSYSLWDLTLYSEHARVLTIKVTLYTRVLMIQAQIVKRGVR